MLNSTPDSASFSWRGALPVAALVLVTIEWGGGYVVAKAVVDATPPVALAFFRACIAMVVLFPFAWSRRPRTSPPSWRDAAALGLTGGLLYSTTFHLGLEKTTATNAAVIQGVLPAVAAVLAWTLYLDRPTAWQVSGVVVVVLGGIGLGWVGASEREGAASLVGDALVFVSVLAWAIYLVQLERLAEVDSLVVATIASAGAAVWLAPAALLELVTMPRQPVSVLAWTGVVYLGAVSSGLVLVLYTYALQRLGTVTTASFANLMPLVAAAAAAVFLGERPSAGVLVAGLIVLIGVACVTRGGAGRRPEVSPIMSSRS